MEKEKMKNEVMSLFPIPLVKINIGRVFTKEELQFMVTDLPMRKEGIYTHQSKDYYLFDNFASDRDRKTPANIEESTYRRKSFLEDIFIQNRTSTTTTEELKGIKKFCESQLKKYLEEIEGVDTDTTRLRITQSWLNKTKPQEFHPVHFHPNSYLSGVLYISCLPNDSINFDNRLRGMYNNIVFPQKKLTVWNSMGVTITITEGDLILFPSWVPHHVGINETKDKERISLAFNTFPVGEIGEYNDATHLKL